MIDRLKEIRDCKTETPAKWANNAFDSLHSLITELEAKEAAQTPVKGQLNFYTKGEEGQLLDCKIVDLENVIIHEGDISNGRKWYAISGILIDKE